MNDLAAPFRTATLHPNILATIGNTPIVRVEKLAPAGIELYAKLEAFNPMGSVKDRLALAVIEAAERDGTLKPGQTVIEATSGNTGIGLAMVCAQKGYPLVVVMAESFSIERRRLMRFLGAKVVLTPASEKGSGMLKKAIELAAAHGWFLCRQFTNEANADVHSATTAREILAAFPGNSLDAFVTGFGTGGTLKGVARVLRRESPGTRIVAAEPDNSPLARGGHAQVYDGNGDPVGSHPHFRPHVMQGWSPDFVSKLANDALESGLVDEVLGVAGTDAIDCARRLAREEGIFCGISAGATLAAAIDVARRMPDGSRVLCMLPDTGERYLSTVLFEDVKAEMDDEERAISDSTPNQRFVAGPPPASAAKPWETATISPVAAKFVDAAIHSKDEPVVMFALEWCEFCAAARKLFRALGVPFRAIDLDSAPFQAGGRGSQIRMALAARLGVMAFPQVFVGGRHVGGVAELIKECGDGRLATALGELGLACTVPAGFEPKGLLPKWMQPR